MQLIQNLFVQLKSIQAYQYFDQPTQYNNIHD